MVSEENFFRQRFQAEFLIRPSMATPNTNSRRKTRQLVVALLVVLGVGVVAGLTLDSYGIIGSGPSPSNPAPAALAQAPASRVEALGRLEPEGGIVNIGVGVPMGDRLSVVLVKEGDEVAKGQELARLESYQDRRAECELAASQLAEA